MIDWRPPGRVASQSQTGRRHRDRQIFTLTFPPTGQFTWPACLWSGGGIPRWYWENMRTPYRKAPPPFMYFFYVCSKYFDDYRDNIVNYQNNCEMKFSYRPMPNYRIVSAKWHESSHLLCLMCSMTTLFGSQLCVLCEVY